MRSYCRMVLANPQKSLKTYKTYVLLITITVIFVWSIAWSTVLDSYFYDSGHQLVSCYAQKVKTMDDKHLQLLDEKRVKKQSIFFHETSCSVEPNDDIRLNARQACAVESAALTHRNTQVYLLILTPVSRNLNETHNKLVKSLLNYPNINIRRIDFNSYLEGTPLEKLGKIQVLRRSKWPVSHASDILRYTTLYKFRGTYLDLDVIVLKSMANMSNFVGAESKWSLGAGVINFSDDETGHQMSEGCAHELQSVKEQNFRVFFTMSQMYIRPFGLARGVNNKKFLNYPSDGINERCRHYEGSDWGANGPGVITRVLHGRCNVTDVSSMLKKSECKKFHVLPVSAFYAFPFRKSSSFFNPGSLAYYKRLLNKSLVIHFWNKFTKSYKMPRDNENVPFLYYAKKHCPVIYETVRGVF